MKIAILGATSQIAKDLIVSFARHIDHYCVLFSRSSSKVTDWLNSVNLTDAYESYEYVDFGGDDYDAIINFVGVGDPARAKAMGASIFEITHQYDQMALDYIQRNSRCKYIFLSSGAVYGDVFDKPVNKHSCVKFPINDLNPSHWYGMAKLYAEARHRSLPELSIVDVRVFNYFSHTQDMNANFFITELVRALQNNKVFKTLPVNIVRDFITPPDFFNLIESIIQSPPKNVSVDCYTRSPIEKFNLLSAMQDRFGLQYELIELHGVVHVTGCKLCYYSLNKNASRLGYEPNKASLEGILLEAEKFLISKSEARKLL